MSELKPCPFCGAEAKVEEHGSVKIVGCSKISMLCPNPRMTVYDNDFSHWNKRASDDTITEQEKVISELVDGLSELVNDCINFDEGLLTKSILKKSVRLLEKHKQSKGE